jgi:hypothetical protein
MIGVSGTRRHIRDRLHQGWFDVNLRRPQYDDTDARERELQS